MKVNIPVVRLDPRISLPKYAYSGDAGFDLAAAADGIIYPHQNALIGTGLIFEIPLGYEIQVRSRSGLASRGIVVANSPATIDSGWRGETKVLIWNNNHDAFRIKKGDKLAQAVLAISTQANFIEISPDDLSATDRGDKGFGSSGVAASVD